jgi:hypothetical protein
MAKHAELDRRLLQLERLEEMFAEYFVRIEGERLRSAEELAGNLAALPENTGSEAGGLVEKCRRFLSTMLPLQAATEMGEARLSTQAQSAVGSNELAFSGVQEHLTSAISDARSLQEELSWARGFLRIDYGRSKDGRIMLLQGSVERQPAKSTTSSPIVLRFRDRYGGEEILELKPDRGFAVVQQTSLKGDSSDIELTILVRSNG